MAPTLPTLEQYEIFGRYRLVGLISTGGMAELFLALQEGVEGFTKVVAVKRVLPHFSRSQTFTRMFLDEARLAARLDHPHIVRIYDLGELDHSYFMAMEYLPGEDLARVCHGAYRRQQKIPFEIAAWIVQAAADGLHYAHDMQSSEGVPIDLIHRDVNPSNIIVTYHGAVKVVDFGIAKAGSNTAHSHAGTLKGKLAYLAPEQVRGERLDRRADIFGLGIVLWELITGSRLFKRDNDAASMSAIANGDIPPPSKRRPDVPAELQAIALKALAVKPGERYQSAGEMSDALESFLSALTIRPTPKMVGQWLESLFGFERAEAKRAIAQGRNLTTAISQVMKPLSPEQSEMLPVSRVFATPSVRRTPTGTRRPPSELQPLPPPPLSQRPRILRVAGFLGFVLLVGTASSLIASGITSSPLLAATAPAGRSSLNIESSPPGASVFLDGEPTGRTTPTTIQGLPGSREVRIRLEKTGFAPSNHSVLLRPGQTEVIRLELKSASARVKLVGVGPNARVLVNGQASSSGDVLELTAGRYNLALEVGGRVLETRSVDVQPGEQTISFQRQ